ncbi:MAG: hypothetical protein M9921_01610 [Fimbriimonadaceae bacterium]|nr:hypothetical protein [Fimbriimonadaceae bacterium]
MLAIAIWLFAFPDLGGTLLRGPVAGVLVAGDLLSWARMPSRDLLVDIEWSRSGRRLARIELDNPYVDTEDPARIVRHHGRAFLNFWSCWGTGCARRFALIENDPPRLVMVGKFENGTVEGFEKTGTVRAFPRHEGIDESIRTGHDVWVERTYHWNDQNRSFDLVKRALVTEMPKESAWRFRR